MKFPSTLLIFTVCLIVSCQDKNEKITKTRLPDGRYVHMPYTIKNGDTILNGIAKYYSSNKKLTDEYEFRDSKRNGWHYHYDSGRLFSKVMLVNDSATGQGFFYNREGKIERENFYYKDKLMVSTFFHRNGTIRLIDFYDNGRAFYAIKYDSAGKKMDERGIVFAYNFISNQELDSIKKETLFEMKIPVVFLPEYFTNIQIVKFNKKKDVYDLKDSLPIKKYFAVYQTFFKDPGRQMLGIAGELTDRNGKIIRRDTLYQQINVIK